MDDKKIIIDRCYVCGRVEDDGEFVDIEDFLDHELNEEEDDFDYSDGVCPDCYESEKERMMNELKELEENKI